MSLTKTERLIISQQLRILAEVQSDSASTHNEHAEIIERGYVGLYGTVFEGIWDETSQEIYDEVAEIFDMYRMLNNYKLKGNPLPKGHYAEFQGFDGNQEVDHHSIGSFMVKEQGKWAELKGRPMNSHAHSLQAYRRMLAEWQTHSKAFDPSAEQVAAIIAAGDR